MEINFSLMQNGAKFGVALAVMLGLDIPTGIPVSTRHDTGTGMEYEFDSSNFNWTRQEFFL